MKRFCLILFVLVLALAPSVVAADSWFSDDGTILYYDGVPISWPSDPAEQESLMEALDAVGPPPPPPGWEPPAQPQRDTATYKNQGSGPAAAKPEPSAGAFVTHENMNSGATTEWPIDYDWTGQEYWLWT